MLENKKYIERIIIQKKLVKDLKNIMILKSLEKNKKIWLKVINKIIKNKIILLKKNKINNPGINFERDQIQIKPIFFIWKIIFSIQLWKGKHPILIKIPKKEKNSIERKPNKIINEPNSWIIKYFIKLCLSFDKIKKIEAIVFKKRLIHKIKILLEKKNNKILIKKNKIPIKIKV